MKALLLSRDGDLRVDDVPVPDRAGECRVRVHAAGICGTDLQLLHGYAGFEGVPGHEFCGTVDRVSRPEDESWLGTRVVGEINIGCGRCTYCRSGVKEHCTNRTVLGIRGRDGCFAEYITLPASNLHRLPDTLDDLDAVFTEPVAAACRILEQVHVGPPHKALVLGDGRLGLIIAQVLGTTGAGVVVLGKHPEKLAVARALGLHAVDALPATGMLFDLVVDATGRAEGLTRALRLVKPRGTVVLKTTAHDATTMETWPIVVDEVTLVGSRCGPFVPALTMLEAGTVRVRPLIALATDLEDYERAFATARTGLKVIFRLAEIPQLRDARR